MGVRPVHRDLGLNRAESQVDSVLGRGTEGVAVDLEAAPGWLEGGIWDDVIARGPAQEGMYGETNGFPAQIPERHVDRTQGVHNHTAPAVHSRPDVGRSPQFADLKRVRADEEIADRLT